MHQDLSRSLLRSHRSVDDFASRIGDLRDGRRNRVAQGEAMVSHPVNLRRGIGTDTQYVGYGICGEK